MRHILIYDLETSSRDTAEAVPRLAGFKSSKREGFFYTTSIEEMLKVIEQHDVIVGFNNKNYDDVIMEKFGANFKGKTIIDCWEVADKRKGIIKIGGKSMDEQVPDLKMESISPLIGGPSKEGDIDYEWFQREFAALPPDVQNRAINYVKTDIEMTEAIFKFFEQFFDSFKEYLTQEQVNKYHHITASVAAYAYKVICNLAGLPEEYDEMQKVTYPGAFVATPTRSEVSGDIYEFDFSSLYPHIIIQCNLYGRVVNGTGWKGHGIFATDGTYDNKRMSKVCEVLKNLYQQRKTYKKQGDSKEFTLKIVLNTIYGLLGNPKFKSVYDWVAASDCTRIGRQWIRFVRDELSKHGYETVYTDTDSVYVYDHLGDFGKLQAHINDIITTIKSQVPFPQETFNMTLDTEIEYMMFATDEDGRPKKKNYLYLTKDKEIVIKGLPLKKRNSSKVAQHVFDKYIKPAIINEHNAKFPKETIKNWCKTELHRDMSLAANFMNIKPADKYSNTTSIQAQIALDENYGYGVYNMVKMRCEHPEGAGKHKNYVDLGRLTKDDIPYISLEKPLKELAAFRKQTQATLGAWILS